MTFDFLVAVPGYSTPMSFTFDAPSENAARLALSKRMLDVGITASELAESTVAVTIARKGHA